MCCNRASRKHRQFNLEELVKANLDKKDTEDNTILHYAARNQSADVMKKLIELGLDKDAKNHDNETAAKVAERWKNKAAASVF